jgi:hypothetical protein
VLLESNCLTEHIKNPAGFAKWNDRIQQIPKYFIEETVSGSVAFGLPEAHVEFCTQFLLSRREKLLQLVQNHKDVFTNIERELFQ